MKDILLGEWTNKQHCDLMLNLGPIIQKKHKCVCDVIDPVILVKNWVYVITKTVVFL